MTTWTVAGQIVGEAGPGLWVRVMRVLFPDGEEMPLREEPVCLLRGELVTTARAAAHAAYRVRPHEPALPQPSVLARRPRRLTTAEPR
jgi:hypothetical protein